MECYAVFLHHWFVLNIAHNGCGGKDGYPEKGSTLVPRLVFRPAVRRRSSLHGRLAVRAVQITGLDGQLTLDTERRNPLATFSADAQLDIAE